MENTGYIYKIVNDINDKVYIGQTTRNLQTRFSEHCFDKRSNSKIHKAISEFGYSHFKIVELEKVPLEQLDEREQYNINLYNSIANGYNISPYKSVVGTRLYYQLVCVENNYSFDSAEFAGKIFHELTQWGERFIVSKLREVSDNGKEFLGYHWKNDVNIPEEDLTPIDEIENWIKTMAIRYQGKRVRCVELDIEFNTHTEMAKYLIDNNYYIGDSKTQIQSVITSIARNIKKNAETTSFTLPLTFEELPGAVKSSSGDNSTFENKPILCEELNKRFNSQTEAVEYFYENHLFGNVKKKTIKLRISDICRGYFTDYKGYSFKYCD